MKIKLSQLRKIIREEVEKSVGTTFDCRTCGKYVSGRSDGTFDEPGWKRLAGIDGPNSICPDCVDNPHALDDFRDEYPNVRIMETLSRPGSFAFGDSPDPQDVHDAFLKLRDFRGQVPIQKLSDELGVHVNRIDFNGTGLRVENTIVTELLGDTPYRTDR